MSTKHPVIAVTGSSGAGTTTAKRAFEHIFQRQKIKAAVIEGDSFHRYDRAEMKVKMAEAGLSHFGPEANQLDKLAELFKTYGAIGGGEKRYYLHSQEEADEHNRRLGTNKKPGEFTPWEPVAENTHLLLYEGLHGLAKTDTDDVARHVDLGIGVVPVINLEWIQKIHRDNAERGHTAEMVMDSILRRMPDYIKHITPQFSRTDINFQRVATVDTSNPFVARDIPTPDESFVVIRFANPKKFAVNFADLVNLIPGSFMSRRNTIVVPGGKMGDSMKIILAPIVDQIMDAARA